MLHSNNNLHVIEIAAKSYTLYRRRKKKYAGIYYAFPHLLVSFSKFDNTLQNIWRDKYQDIMSHFQQRPYDKSCSKGFYYAWENFRLKINITDV